MVGTILVLDLMVSPSRTVDAVKCSRTTVSALGSITSILLLLLS